MADKVGGRRRPTGKLSIPTAGQGDVSTKHNEPSAEEKKRAQQAAEEAQLRSYMAAFLPMQTKIEKIAAELKAAKDEMADTMTIAAQSLRGTTKAEIKQLIKESRMPRKDLQEVADRMARYRRALALPTEMSPDMIEKLNATPVEVRDELYWEAEGYARGIRGEGGGAPDGMEARFGPHFSTGWDNAQARRAADLTAIAALKPKMAAPPPAAPVDDGPAHPSDVTKESVEKAKAALANIGKKASPPADDFEAPEDELAKQTTRAVVKAQSETSEAL